MAARVLLYLCPEFIETVRGLAEVRDGVKAIVSQMKQNYQDVSGIFASIKSDLKGVQISVEGTDRQVKKLKSNQSSSVTYAEAFT